MTPDQRRHLTELIAAARDGSLDAAGWQRLSELAQHDPDALPIRPHWAITCCWPGGCAKPTSAS